MNSWARAFRAGLAQHGFQVDWVRDGVAAERELATGAYQAAVLDLGLPRQDGMEVLRQTRARRNTTPVLVLTARDAVPARIEGLDAGPTITSSNPSTCTNWPPACAPGAPRPWAKRHLSGRWRCGAGPGCTPGAGPRPACGTLQPRIRPAARP